MARYSPELVEARLRAYASQPPQPGDAATIQNRTCWQKADLRRLVNAVCDSMKVSRRRTVVFDYHANGKLGRASIEGRWCIIALPKHARVKTSNRGRLLGATSEDALRGPALALLARVLVHEIEHNLGLTHEHIHGGCVVAPQPTAEKAVELLQVRVRAGLLPKPKPNLSPAESTALRREKALERARAGVERWEREVRLSSRRLAKWRRRLRGLERAAAARAAKENLESASTSEGVQA